VGVGAIVSRPVTLFTGQWADLPIEDLATMARGWGFDGLELACWGDHFEVDQALADEGYCRSRQEILERNHLNVWAIGAHLVGQAVCDRIDERHRAILPPEIYGDGEPEGVRQRAADRMKDTARAAARLGVQQVNGFSSTHSRRTTSRRSSGRTRTSPGAGTRSWTSSTPRASGSASRCTRPRSPTTS